MAQGKQQQREYLAYLTARLIAEDGSLDYAQAKRKAARQLGITNPQSLPDNREIEEALSTWHNLYQADELKERINSMRHVALELMESLKSFHPYLVGAVLTGNPGPHSSIVLHLYTHQDKEFELTLLNQGVDYHSLQRSIKWNGKTYLGIEFTFIYQNYPIEILVLPDNLERTTLRSGEGHALERANLSRLKDLIDQASFSISAAWIAK